MSHAPHALRHEHEFEPEYGLPERLPTHETKLWQGSPDAWQVTRRVFHWNKLALYFGVITLARVATLVAEGAPAAALGPALAQLLPLFGLCLAMLGLIGWLTARTTVYTLTDRRVVMRVGIVLTVTYNLPLARIDAAHLHPLGSGHGDIALALKADTRIAYLHLWPHVRPWHFVRTQPMLRALPHAEHVAEQLASAWAAANQQAARTTAAEPAPSPQSPASPAGRPAGLGLGEASLVRG